MKALPCVLSLTHYIFNGLYDYERRKSLLFVTVFCISKDGTNALIMMFNLLGGNIGIYKTTVPFKRLTTPLFLCPS